MLNQIKVTIAEGFAETDLSKNASISESQLDEIFKKCRRELPGYQIREIVEKRTEKGDIRLLEFAHIFMNQRSNDVSNMFKNSIKEAKGKIFIDLKFRYTKYETS